MRAGATLIRALVVVCSFFAEGTMAVRGAHVARQETSTSSAPAPSITLRPVFTFTDPLPQPFTCQSATIPWFYNGPESPLTLVVTNVGVSQDVPAPPVPSTTTTRRITLSNDARRAVPTGAAEPSSITTIIASNLDPGTLNYTWPSVNVPQGWYMLSASLPQEGYSTNSATFFVHTGGSTSCLPIVVTSSSTSPTTPTEIPSTTTTTLPVGASSSSVSIGAIVGISIGAVALVAAILSAWLCLYRKGKKLHSGASTGGGGGGISRRWDGLSSVDSSLIMGGGGGSKRTERHDSMGTVLMTSEEAVGTEKGPTQNVDDSPFNDPVALSPLSASRQSSRAPERTYSTSSSINEYNALPPARRPSVPDSVLGRRSIDSTNAYPPSSPSSPHNLRTSSTPVLISRNNSLRTQQPSPAPRSSNAHSPISPSSPSDASKQANRQSFGARKRKPVPAYDSALADEPALSASPPPVPASPSPSPEHAAGAAGGSAGHYATRSQAGHDGSRQELAHKSSFGPGGIEGKPMHYLIPDMPMPAKD